MLLYSYLRRLYSLQYFQMSENIFYYLSLLKKYISLLKSIILQFKRHSRSDKTKPLKETKDILLLTLESIEHNNKCTLNCNLALNV